MRVVTKQVLGLLAVAAFLPACNDNGVIGLPADIAVNPEQVDFGRVEQHEDFGQVVVVSNAGKDQLSITGIRIEPTDAPYGVLGTLPTASAPWSLPPGDWKSIDVHFTPQLVGDAPATLYIESNDPDEPSLAVPLGGRGYAVQTDSFTQGQQIGGIADILFVVDNSGSMSDKQTTLGNSFGTFINWLVGANVDYRIAVTTTDMASSSHQGRFQGNPKIIDPSTTDVINKFKANVNVGSSGSATEKGLAGGLAAVSAPLDTADNAGFLRANARLYVVYVSDEDDYSGDAVQDYITGFNMVKGGDPTKVFHAAIAGPTPSGCFSFSGSAAAGVRYKAIVDQTGGLFGSICESDFGVTLQNLAFEVTSASGEFFLTETPDPQTLEVFVDGVQQSNAVWGYSVATNSILFYEPDIPAPGAYVDVRYEVL